MSINGVHSKLDLLHEEGLSNISQVIHLKLYSKSNPDQLLICSPSLQDPLHRHDVDEVIHNIVHHTPQLEEVFPRGTIEKESLHKISMTAIDRLQMGIQKP